MRWVVGLGLSSATATSSSAHSEGFRYVSADVTGKRME